MALSRLLCALSPMPPRCGWQGGAPLPPHLTLPGRLHLSGRGWSKRSTSRADARRRHVHKGTLDPSCRHLRAQHLRAQHLPAARLQCGASTPGAAAPPPPRAYQRCPRAAAAQAAPLTWRNPLRLPKIPQRFPGRAPAPWAGGSVGRGLRVRVRAGCEARGPAGRPQHPSRVLAQPPLLPVRTCALPGGGLVLPCPFLLVPAGTGRPRAPAAAPGSAPTKCLCWGGAGAVALLLSAPSPPRSSRGQRRAGGLAKKPG